MSDRLHESFDESDVYRIDHYLGKETVQNILAFRFGNGIFEPLWNRRYVNHVQITGAESIGVEGRGAYYQEAGALDDMIQNHLLQVMATIAMEPSATFRANSVRDERSKLLRSIRPMTPDEVRQNTVAGQYGPASIGGKDVPGFRQEPGVDPKSQTNTFAAVTLFVDNWRWAGVPFYIRTGKRLAKRVTEISIQFNEAPLHIFDQDGADSAPNLLIVRIQPEEGISLKFRSKRPGAGMTLRPVSMDFNYGSSFGERSPSAYETLLLDAIIGDATLYTRQDMVEASWMVVEPIQNLWRDKPTDFPNYPAGTWGPAAADAMLAQRGRVWRKLIMGATISPDHILKELADLWVDTAKQGQADNGSGVLRACSMTLLVLTEAGEDTQDLRRDYCRAHARASGAHGASGAVEAEQSGRSLAGQVYSQCWMPFGQRRQICCEQVEITASDIALADLQSVILPLANCRTCR